MTENVTTLLEAKRVRCTAPVPNRDYVVNETYDVHPANHGGAQVQLWIGTKGIGGHMFEPDDAAKHFTPAP